MNKTGNSPYQQSERGPFFPARRCGGRLGLLLLLLCSPLAASAQVVKLLDYTNTVRYNHADNLDGLAWTNRTFNDSTWFSGPGLLAFEDNASILPLVRTALPSPVNLTPPGHAVYFRAHFNCTFKFALLSFSNYVDDGAVFYLNGVEIKRLRVAAGTPNHLTLASPPSTENTVDAFTYLAPSLISSDNVLAVSVHQSATTSGDIVFGSTIWAEVLTPLQITVQPQSQVVPLNGTTTFSVTLSGSLPLYRWQFMDANWNDFANIGGATNADYGLSVVTGRAGYYRCIISNSINVVTSSVATLTVTPDITPPRLLAAVADQTTNHIFLTFSEPVLFIFATNLSNYRITELGGTNELSVTNAAVNGSMVRLMVQPWFGYPSPSPRDYVLTVNNVTDRSTNAIAPNTRIGIAFWRQVVPMNAFWNWNEDFDLAGQDWTSPRYDETTNEWFSGGQWVIPDPNWDPVGRATFYFQVVASYSLWPPGNMVLTFGRSCYYFRKRFVIRPDASPPGTLRLTYLVDDGAVFYLNGVEVFRDNLPGDPIGYSTLAASQRSQTLFSRTKDVAVTNLLAGTNVLAVELHPFSTLPLVEEGIAFGAAVDAAIAPVVPPEFSPLWPWLGLTRISEEAVVISWSAAGCVLQTKLALDGNWSDLPDATSPFTNAVTATRFFRLRCP